MPYDRRLRTLAEGVQQLAGRPPNAINVHLAGDVFFNLPSLRPPPRLLTYDREVNRASMRRLAALRPALVLFGHGPPLRDPERLAHVAAG